MFILFYTPLPGCPLPGASTDAKPATGVGTVAALPAQPPLRIANACMTQAVVTVAREICPATRKQEKRKNDCGEDVFMQGKVAQGKRTETIVKPGGEWTQCVLNERDPGVVTYRFCYASDMARCRANF